MLTIYKTAEAVLDHVNWKITHIHPRTSELMDRLELLRQMLIDVEPEQLVAVDEELYKLLDI